MAGRWRIEARCAGNFSNLDYGSTSITVAMNMKSVYLCMDVVQPLSTRDSRAVRVNETDVSRVLFVGNLPSDITEQELRWL